MPAGLHTFQYEIELPGDMTRVICRGALVNQTAGRLNDVVKPLIAAGGRIVLDFKDVIFVDSMGLGVLVGLKIAVTHQAKSTLEIQHLSPRVQELLRITNLLDLFKA
jgi:anti-anti-sigma factor